jgi:hypothetical protein
MDNQLRAKIGFWLQQYRIHIVVGFHTAAIALCKLCSSISPPMTDSSIVAHILCLNVNPHPCLDNSGRVRW